MALVEKTRPLVDRGLNSGIKEKYNYRHREQLIPMPSAILKRVTSGDITYDELFSKEGIEALPDHVLHDWAVFCKMDVFKSIKCRSLHTMLDYGLGCKQRALLEVSDQEVDYLQRTLKEDSWHDTKFTGGFADWKQSNTDVVGLYTVRDDLTVLTVDLTISNYLDQVPYLIRFMAERYKDKFGVRRLTRVNYGGLWWRLLYSYSHRQV